MKKSKTPKQYKSEIRKLQVEILKTKSKLNKLRQSAPLEQVDDYLFLAGNGQKVKLSELFGKKQDLILVHNMGKKCPYCTLWADGYNGQLAHIENRAAFAVISPDTPAVQKKFAGSRGWKFRMYSDRDRKFTDEMGYLRKGHHWPGVSTFYKDKDGRIFRVATTEFGPGDDFCPTLAFFDLLKAGPGKWEAKFKY